MLSCRRRQVWLVPPEPGTKIDPGRKLVDWTWDGDRFVSRPSELCGGKGEVSKRRKCFCILCYPRSWHRYVHGVSDCRLRGPRYTGGADTAGLRRFRTNACSGRWWVAVNRKCFSCGGSGG